MVKPPIIQWKWMGAATPGDHTEPPSASEPPELLPEPDPESAPPELDPLEPPEPPPDEPPELDPESEPTAPESLPLPLPDPASPGGVELPLLLPQAEASRAAARPGTHARENVMCRSFRTTP